MESAFNETDKFNQEDFDRLVALSAQRSSVATHPQPVPQETTGVVSTPDNRIMWIAGGILGVAILSALVGGGLGLASNLSKPKPQEPVASKNVEIAPPSDEVLQNIIKPTPAPSPVVQITGNATVVVPTGYDSLTVRNSDGLAIGEITDGDRVTVIRDAGDRVVVRAAELTGSVVSRGIRQDN